MSRGSPRREGASLALHPPCPPSSSCTYPFYLSFPHHLSVLNVSAFLLSGLGLEHGLLYL